ncbi:MAG: oxidative damage protection protein [Gammaproteobacteria bacterium]|jgi:Fe-S cluster biosynthesis and repair protein YggX|nr:oxidative damage protection protein [Gammaproteobacteria bacterium]MBT5216385.1 oxidative damage protection protein [Gammaproteobacteria bacterium]MBT5542664.1 oxidative damage protection protein [Gammaproteobacteria bacterium]MBT6074750.1 oxidative damage protection protein [Gammaproteobacteria bacterium]MBT7752957.1 oxidative damage protection protein [Gammaproteobacteria bacterium]
MNEKIICSYFKDEREVMDRVPYPGELGEKIYKEISKEAWQLWLEHQTMLINENRLSMVDPEARKYLQNEMKKFLFEGHSSKPTEYVPVQE